MPAQLLALALSLATGGELGASSQTGNPGAGTLGGPKQWPWNSLLGPSLPQGLSKEYRSSGTTQASLKVGGQDAAAMLKPTESSEEFTSFWTNTVLSSRPNTSIPRITLQTVHQGASFPQRISSSPQSKYQMKSNPSSSVSTPPHIPAKTLLLNVSLPYPRHSYPHRKLPDEGERTTALMTHTSTNHKFAHLVQAIIATTPNDQNDLSPPLNEPCIPSLKPSPLRPECDANKRLRVWTPENPRNALDDTGHPTNLKEEDLRRISNVLEEAYAPSTRGTYSMGLFAFHLFCDLKDIKERHRSPADPTVLASFISLLAGIYAGSTIKNFVYGVRAWHIIHGMAWKIDADQLQALLTASKRLTPANTKKDEKAPWSVEYLEKICEGLNTKTPKDVAIRACLTTAFWGTARVGEVTVPNPQSFDPSKHVKPSDVRFNVQARMAYHKRNSPYHGPNQPERKVRKSIGPSRKGQAIPRQL